MNKNRLIATEEEQINSIVNSKNFNNPQGQINLDVKIDFIKNLISQIKDKRVEKIFRIRYFNSNRKKTPWAKIAKELGVSTQTAINLHNKTIKLIKTKMTSKNNFAMDTI
tara:strand:- start:172 stop:501 length:330 start_codon:yes stop_codon:yes gene_type:complete